MKWPFLPRHMKASESGASGVYARSGNDIKKSLLRFLAAVCLPLVVIFFVVSEHAGWWDRYLGLDDVLEAAGRFETSYAEDVRRVITPSDAAWVPVVDLIYSYSPAELPTDRQPRILARFPAVASAKAELGAGRIAEWTAPSTPIVLLYKDWP